jgi:hypothetical protein
MPSLRPRPSHWRTSCFFRSVMKRERQVNRERVQHQPPEPEEQTTYKEATTVTDDERPPMKGPPQETGTTEPRD